MSRRHRLALRVAFGILCFGGLSETARAQVTAEMLLGYKPSQRGIDFDSPGAEEISKCRVEIENVNGRSGYLLYGPNGQLLRRFMDTDGDRNVDEFRYYKHGIEVYRDLDTTGDNEIDQFRWLNLGGTRWGVDTNGDRRIDTWKILSAEEATREAILAMAAQDERRLMAVMITEEDLSQLGILGDSATRLSANIKEAPTRLRTTLSQTKLINSRTEWVRFDCSMLMPNLIPAEPGKTKQDLMVYENVMAFIQNGDQTGYVQVGEMVKVGDVWKLTQIPQPLEGERLEITSSGVLLQPALSGGATTMDSISPRMKELIEQLRALDESAPHANPTPESLTKYNVARAKLLTQLAEESSTAEERRMWNRQRIEGIAAATQNDAYPNGREELLRSEQQLRQSGLDRELLAFTIFQRMLVDYNLELAKASTADQPKVQENWLKNLEAFVSEYPDASESADALWQLAITHEFSGDAAKARATYQKLASTYGSTRAAEKARGALTRLDLSGKPLRLQGKSFSGPPLDTAAYRGKVLAVIFWATWCQPCVEELPQIKELYRQYQKDGFEVLGVNLDDPSAPIGEYIKQFSVPWPHLHEEGALEGRHAVEYGIISLPTMFLVDKTGTVVSAGVTLDDLKKQVPELLKK